MEKNKTQENDLEFLKNKKNNLQLQINALTKVNNTSSNENNSNLQNLTTLKTEIKDLNKKVRELSAKIVRQDDLIAKLRTDSNLLRIKIKKIPAILMAKFAEIEKKESELEIKQANFDTKLREFVTSQTTFNTTVNALIKLFNQKKNQLYARSKRLEQRIYSLSPSPSNLAAYNNINQILLQNYDNSEEAKKEFMKGFQ
jgi:chromosome segregation ATPase